MKLVEIASQLECSAATIRTWKNRYKWDADESETFQKKNETKRNVSKSNASKKQSEETAVADEVRQVIQNTNLTDKQQLFVYITSDVSMLPRHTRKRMAVTIVQHKVMATNYLQILTSGMKSSG